MRRIIDGNGRLFGKISVIDIIVILAVLVMAAAVYMKYNVLDKTDASVTIEAVTYEVTVKQVRESSARHLRAGDPLYTDTGIPLGVIREVAVSDCILLAATVEGVYKEVPVEGRKDVVLLVEAQCSESNGRYYVDRIYELNINIDQRMVTKYNAILGTITDIFVPPVAADG